MRVEWMTFKIKYWTSLSLVELWGRDENPFRMKQFVNLREFCRVKENNLFEHLVNIDLYKWMHNKLKGDLWTFKDKKVLPYRIYLCGYLIIIFLHFIFFTTGRTYVYRS